MGSSTAAAELFSKVGSALSSTLASFVADISTGPRGSGFELYSAAAIEADVDMVENVPSPADLGGKASTCSSGLFCCCCWRRRRRKKKTAPTRIAAPPTAPTATPATAPEDMPVSSGEVSLPDSPDAASAAPWTAVVVEAEVVEVPTADGAIADVVDNEAVAEEDRDVLLVLSATPSFEPQFP